MAGKKDKYLWVVIVIIAVIFGGFIWYQSYSAKKSLNSKTQVASDSQGNAINENLAQNADDQSISDIADESDQPDKDYNAICENGEWYKIADQSGDLSTVSGKLRRVYPGDEATPSEFTDYLYYLEGTNSYAVADKKVSDLDYFENRQVELQGVLNPSKKEIAVSQIKCAGDETDKNLISDRNKLMDYMEANINSITPKKAPYKKWTIDTIEFVDKNNFYVEYYDAIEDDENSDIDEDTARKILVEATQSGSGYNAKVLAYWEMGEDDYELKQGTDKFENAVDTMSYQYDPDEKSWTRID
ncbi:MAG: hypothetical protein WC858_01180 [Parcubacteria group bacterium]|jgi:hypothetical protein